MKRKTIYLLLALAMIISLFAGCGGAASKSEAVSAPVSSVAEPAPTDAPAAPTAAEPEPEPEPADYPLCDEPETLSIFMLWNANLSNFMPDYYDDNPSMTRAAELTNVSLEYTYVSTEDGPTQFGILAAAGSLPDIVHRAMNWYSGTRDDAVEEGIYLDLTEYFAEDGLLSNYYNVLKKYDLIDKATGKSDSGSIVTVDKVNDATISSAITGFSVRTDYLDKIGWKAEDITTYDEWYEVLSAMKTELNLSAPLLMPATGTTINLTSGFGVSLATTFIAHVPYVVNGKVTFGYLEDGFTDYIETMSKWYADGLIYPDFYTDAKYMFVPMESAEKLYNGDCGMWFSSKWIFGNGLEANFTDVEGFDYSPVAQPKIKDGDPNHLMSVFTDRVGDGCAVSGDSKNPELAVKWLNFWFSETGYDLANYGIEDLTYTVNPDGTKSYTDLMIANPDGMSFALAISAKTGECLDMCEYWAEKLNLTYTEKQRLATDIWARGVDDEWLLPNSLTLSSEDSAEFSTLFADIQTLLNETVVSLIIGQTALDQIPVFQQRLHDLNIDRCIEIYQAAYAASK